MKLRIQSFWEPSAQEWDNAWEKCPFATYFQSREWAEIWSTYSHGKTKPSPRGLVFSDGVRVILPLSLARFHRGFGHRYLASPAGTFGGWLAERHLDDDHQRLTIDYLRKHIPNLVWRNNPYEPISTPISFGSAKADETYVLDLTEGFDEIYRKGSKGNTSAARKAQKAGVSVRLAETEDDWMAYFDVYQDSLRRWGDRATNSYTWRLFSTMWNRHSSSINLWMANADGRCIAGAVCFYGGGHCVYWHGSALEKALNLRPVNLLMYEVIRDATNRGVRWFDFNPSGGLAGVISFKRSFGAFPLSCDLITNDSWKLRAMTKVINIFT